MTEVAKIGAPRMKQLFFVCSVLIGGALGCASVEPSAQSNAASQAHGLEEPCYHPDAFPVVAWSQATAVPADQSWSSVAYSPRLDLFVAGSLNEDGNGIIASSPDGLTWQTRYEGGGPYGNTTILWAPVADAFMAIVNDGDDSGHDHVLTSTDGIEWSEIRDRMPGDGWWLTLMELPDGTLIASSADPSIYRSTDGGETWTGESAPVGGYTYWAASAHSETAAVVAGEVEVAARSTDFGATWSGRSLPEHAGTLGGDWLYGMAYSPTLAMFTTVGYSDNEPEEGYSEMVWRSTDDGATWERGEFDASAYFYAEAWIGTALDPFFLAAGGADEDGPRLAASYDGITWYSDAGPELSAPDWTAAWAAIAYSRSQNRVVMVAYSGEIYAGTPN